MPAIAFPLSQVAGDSKVEVPFIPPLTIKSTLAVTLAQNAIAFIVAPTGTVSAAGVLTFGTAVNTTYPNAYVYVPAGAVAPGSVAGWYYAVMTSTTVGTLYQTAYPGPTGVNAPQIPAAPVAATGPGAYTGVTTAVTGPQYNLPANLAQPNSKLRVNAIYSSNTTGGNKTVGFTLGGSTVSSLTLTTAATQGAGVQTDIWMRGQQAAQVAVNSGNVAGLGSLAAAPTYLTVNMAAAQTVAFTLQLATATDWVCLEGYTIDLLSTSVVATD